LARMRAARNGRRFAALFDSGDLSCHGHDRSRGDYALCDMIAFRVGPDPDRIDRLFRRSALYRPEKWDRPDYRENTIAKVLARRTTYFSRPADDTPIVSWADLLALDLPD